MSSRIWQKVIFFEWRLALGNDANLAVQWSIHSNLFYILHINAMYKAWKEVLTDKVTITHHVLQANISPVCVGLVLHFEWINANAIFVLILAVQSSHLHH